MTVKNTFSSARRGFTIVELVIVIAVVAVLIGILVPVFGSIAEDAEQRSLRMKLDAAYTAFAADCGFRDEPVQNIDKYIFAAEDALAFTSSSVTVKKSGYRWNGDEEGAVASVTPSISASTAIYGPFNGYYLLGEGMVLNWAGAGTAADPYRISSYQDLRSISQQVARGNRFAGKIFRLENDLSVNEISWLPIGGFVAPTQADASGNITFSGTFDGNGHTIALSYGRVLQNGYCLFGSVTGATVKNLRVAGNIDVGVNAGGIAAKAADSTFQNCISTMNVAGDHHVGGIVGNATGATNIFGCMNTGKVEAYATGAANGINSAVGGIVGEAAATVKIQDCSNRGAVMGMGGTVGGIAGIAKGTVSNCINDGAVDAKGFAAQIVSGGKDSLAGGIVGWGAATAKIDRCGSTGAITAAWRSAGGIAGGDAIITNCANAGTVTAKGFVGGIMGTVTNVSCKVTNVANYATVAATGESISGQYVNPAGGIVGKVKSTSAYTVSLAVNASPVQFRKGNSGVTYNEVGMLVGSADGAVNLSNTFLGISGGLGVYVGSNAVTATAVGKSASVSGSATVQANQSTLASALNAAVGSNQAWTKETNFFLGKYVPILTYKPTFSLEYASASATLRLSLDTSFTGAANVYMPFPDQSIYNSANGDRHDFVGWGSSKAAPGAKVALSADTTFSNQWNVTSQVMTPIPFG